MAKLYYTLLFFMIPLISFGQDTREILNHYYEAVGDRSKWQSINTIYEERDVWQNLNYNGIRNDSSLIDHKPSNKHVRYIVFPEMFKVTIYSLSPNQPFTKIRNKNKQVIKVNNMVSKVNANYDGENIDLFRLLDLEKNNKLSFKAEESFNDRDYYVLTATVNNKLVNYCFDKETGYLVGFYSEQENTCVKTIITGYKSISDLMFPLIKASSNNGVQFYLQKTTHLEVDINIDESIFTIR